MARQQTPKQLTKECYLEEKLASHDRFRYTTTHHDMYRASDLYREANLFNRSKA
jgi:hypothetical protein